KRNFRFSIRTQLTGGQSRNIYFVGNNDFVPPAAGVPTSKGGTSRLARKILLVTFVTKEFQNNYEEAIRQGLIGRYVFHPELDSTKPAGGVASFGGVVHHGVRARHRQVNLQCPSKEIVQEPCRIRDCARDQKACLVVIVVMVQRVLTVPCRLHELIEGTERRKPNHRIRIPRVKAVLPRPLE